MKKEKRHRGELMSPGWEDLARKNAARGKFVEKRQNWHDYLDGGDEDADAELSDLDEYAVEASPEETAAAEVEAEARPDAVAESDETSPGPTVPPPTSSHGTSREQSSERE